MVRSRGSFALLLLGAIGAPYLLSSATSKSKDDSKTEADLTAQELAAVSQLSGVLSNGGKKGSRFEQNGPRLEQVFSFGVSTGWVLGSWPRVSTALADLDLQGYRVPLVSGTRTDDIAGSLTYYFGNEQRVERITFVGTTGDARRLVAILAAQHAFARQMTDDPSVHLYQSRKRRRIMGELRIRTSQVVRADSLHSRFALSLEMWREGKARGG